MGGDMGLRERKKAETRQAVHEAALRLAMEHGLDNVTVEAIADAANISRRTFSNYFAGKEDALLYGEEQRLRDLTRRFRARPPGEPSWTALREALNDLRREWGPPEKDWLARSIFAKRHPSLLARQHATYATLESELGQAIAVREGVEPGASLRPRLMAGAFLLALRVATHAWIATDDPRTLAELTDEALHQMAHLLDQA
jgi:AcrR family transcriptional regulator